MHLVIELNYLFCIVFYQVIGGQKKSSIGLVIYFYKKNYSLIICKK
jgi:hypothetical protein